MYNGMMDPEMIRLAQEQMSKISPAELAKIQQQMMSNPELIRLATESMKNMKPEDMRNVAEQLKHVRPEDMAEISEKVAKASPEELNAMRARADALVTYELNAAQMLKKQGNDLHSQGKYRDAAQKYLHAKNNLKNVPASKGRTLQLACSLNLMSCYLKTRQYEDCINEGSEVLEYDAENVKALYRRGQAYKELRKLEAAISDLRKAHAVSPDDETISDALRDASEKAMMAGARHVSQGVIIEEITEDEFDHIQNGCGNGSSSTETQLQESCDFSQNRDESNVGGPTTDAECLQGLKDNPEGIRSFCEFISNTNPDALSALSAGGMSPEMAKAASDMFSKMSPEGLQKMLDIAPSFNGKGPTFPMKTTDPNNHGSINGVKPPEISPDMVKMASDMISKMPPEELQKMFDVAASLNVKDPSGTNGQRSKTSGISREEGITAVNEDIGGSSSGSFRNSNGGLHPSSFAASTTDLQEQMSNQMRDPAMRQMFSSMIKNMSPDMMANMSEQFGMKLSREEAAKAQQVMSSLSAEDLDKMMHWMDKLTTAVNGARNAKNWLLGRPGMIFAICMLILAVILHRLGYVGG